MWQLKVAAALLLLAWRHCRYEHLYFVHLASLKWFLGSLHISSSSITVNKICDGLWPPSSPCVQFIQTLLMVIEIIITQLGAYYDSWKRWIKSPSRARGARWLLKYVSICIIAAMRQLTCSWWQQIMNLISIALNLYEYLSKRTVKSRPGKHSCSIHKRPAERRGAGR